MTVMFPADIVAETADPEFVDFGAILSPISGGPDQRINRNGRYKVKFTMPPLTPDQARRAISRLVQGKLSSLTLPFPQPGVVVGDEGAPRVNGAGQTGSLLQIDGLPPNKLLKEGWAISVTASGRRFLYLISADTNASAGGAVSLPLTPMIRRSPADNAVVEIAFPLIEGAIDGEAKWSIESAVEYGMSFTVRETA